MKRAFEAKNRAKGRLMLIEPPHDACSHLDKNVR